MSQEREGAITFHGNPLTLIGPELKVGQKAPDFKLVDTGLAEVTLADTAGSVRIISVVPSIDTPVCDQQTRRFNEEATGLGDVKVLTVSVDLPFAQKRFCGAAGIENVRTLSDHREASFGKSYGVLVKGLRLLARSLFVVDKKGSLKHVQYVKELTEHPDYDAAIAAAKASL